MSRNRVYVIILLLLIIFFSIIIRTEYVREGGTLLLRYDPYYHYRMAETIIEEGHRPEWDYMASWPTGQPGDRHPPLYHYFLAYSFKLFGNCAHDDLLLWCNYSVALTVILFILLGFLIGRELSDTTGGLFCALLCGVTPYVVSRTILGFADTDGMIILFSLLSSFFWIQSFPFTSKRWMYPMLAGISIFLFEMTWRGFWYMLPLLVGASILVIFIQYIMKKKIDLVHLGLLLSGFFIPHEIYAGNIIRALLLIGLVGSLWISYRFGKQQIFSLILVCVSGYFLYSEGLLPISPVHLDGGTESFIKSGEVFYPYVGKFISQRKDVSPMMLLQSFATLLILAPLGFISLLKRKDERKYPLLVFLFLYSAGGIFTILSGARFLLILSLPVILLSSIILSLIMKTQFRNSPGRKTLVGIGMVLLLMPTYYYAEESNGASSPISDDWMNALQWIENNTSPESVVIGDWGNGYWIESMARRKSIMNGAHYDLYWRILKFGTMMETSDEQLAVKEVFGFENAAEAALVRNFPQGEKGDQLLELEMTSFVVGDQEAYLILDSRNALTFSTITYFGTWDYTTGEGFSRHLYGGTPIGTMFRPQWKEYLFNIGEHIIGIYQTAEEPHSFIVKEDSAIPTQGTVYPADGQPIFLRREEGIMGVAWYHSPSLMIFIPSESLDSMFVRLFFFNGDGLQYFELVGDFNTVKVFKIHPTSRESLNEGVRIIEDTWNPA
ncbi:MAG: glycosyltransferase family 39 protein [Theionarchaea archaeon]|nr:glycosyltransferase family 39 protein [Theionarchaea archaeon]